jgi:hypothetical protein
LNSGLAMTSRPLAAVLIGNEPLDLTLPPNCWFSLSQHYSVYFKTVFLYLYTTFGRLTCVANYKFQGMSRRGRNNITGPSSALTSFLRVCSAVISHLMPDVFNECLPMAGLGSAKPRTFIHSNRWRPNRTHIFH